MASVATDRLDKMKQVLARRQYGLRVVVEEVRKPRNVAALLRTCDSVGVQFVHVVYTGTQPLPLNNSVSKGAHRWVTIIQHLSIEQCLHELRAEGFRIYSTHLDPTAKDFTDVDYTGRVAIVLGNEEYGVSPEALALSDERIVIPQMGFSQSLNVAAATAVILYEALKQRRAHGYYATPDMTPTQMEQILSEWCLFQSP